jgi:hypothetical protein
MSYPQARRNHQRLAAVVAFTATMAVAGAGCAREQSTIPDRLDDTTFWSLSTKLSEEGGYFHSDNFVSNELGFQHVLSELQGLAGGGAYLGVGPDQNYTYVVALRPKIAFIVDIRRQNMMQHLMYKALIEMSSNRSEFLARLFARPMAVPSPPGTATADSLFTWLATLPRDSVLMREQLAAIVRHLGSRRITIDPVDSASIAYVYHSFVAAGPALTYSSNAARGFGGRGMPSFRTIMTATDPDGVNQGYLGSEENFQVLKGLHERNLIVPVVGDFAGSKALRAVGTWIRRMDTQVHVFYVSNVEQYLFQQGEAWQRFYGNVSELPLHSEARFIRSVSNRGYPRQHPLARSASRTSSVREVLDLFRFGRLQSYADIVDLAR